MLIEVLRKDCLHEDLRAWPALLSVPARLPDFPMSVVWSAVLGLALVAGLAAGEAVPASPIKVTLRKRALDAEQIAHTRQAVQQRYVRSNLLGSGEEDIPLLDFLDAQCKGLAGAMLVSQLA